MNIPKAYYYTRSGASIDESFDEQNFITDGIHLSGDVTCQIANVPTILAHLCSLAPTAVYKNKSAIKIQYVYFQKYPIRNENHQSIITSSIILKVVCEKMTTRVETSQAQLVYNRYQSASLFIRTGGNRAHETYSRRQRLEGQPRHTWGCRKGE